jgi:hypothetical protein
MSAAQIAGLLLSFPGGEHIPQTPSSAVLVAQAKEWCALAAEHHFGARVALARGDLDAAVKHLVHEHGKVLQAIAIVKEARGLPIGKRALELEALQLVLSAVGDELAFLPGVTADDTAKTLEAAAERVDNVQARLLGMAEGYRSNSES